jgi:hypothetical protein
MLKHLGDDRDALLRQFEIDHLRRQRIAGLVEAAFALGLGLAELDDAASLDLVGVGLGGGLREQCLGEVVSRFTLGLTANFVCGQVKCGGAAIGRSSSNAAP